MVTSPSNGAAILTPADMRKSPCSTATPGKMSKSTDETVASAKTPRLSRRMKRLTAASAPSARTEKTFSTLIPVLNAMSNATTDDAASNNANMLGTSDAAPNIACAGPRSVKIALMASVK